MSDVVPPNPVSRAVDNVINTPPEFWGVRLAQEIPRMPQNKEDFQVWQGKLDEKDAAKAHTDANEVNQLYRSGDPSAFSNDKLPAHKQEAGDGRIGPDYQNRLFRCPSQEGDTLSQFVLDVFNTPTDDETKHDLNAMLRKLLQLAPIRDKTWKIKDTGNFSCAESLEVRGSFPTEEVLVKVHLYIKLSEDRYIDVLKFSKDPSKRVDDSVNDKPDYDKWKNMGSDRTDIAGGRITSSAKNVIEPGMNHAVILCEMKGDGAIEIISAHLDGDRMVVT